MIVTLSDAMRFTGAAGRIENAGTLFGTRGLVIRGTASADPGAGVWIENSGAIRGLKHGIEASEADAPLALVNSGMILGAVGSYEGGRGSDRLVNAGHMLGDVRLNGGDDATTLRAGRLDGSLWAGQGRDHGVNAGTITRDVRLGEDNGRYDGRGGSVGGTVHGEGGRDRLTGGAGDDNGIEIAAARFGGGLVVGALAASPSRSGTTNRDREFDDRFIFRTTDKTLWFDADGKGGAAAMIADLENGAHLTAADILIV